MLMAVVCVGVDDDVDVGVRVDGGVFFGVGVDNDAVDVSVGVDEGVC